MEASQNKVKALSQSVDERRRKLTELAVKEAEQDLRTTGSPGCREFSGLVGESRWLADSSTISRKVSQKQPGFVRGLVFGDCISARSTAPLAKTDVCNDCVYLEKTSNTREHAQSANADACDGWNRTGGALILGLAADCFL
ncbi:MAG: hypothetical protein HKP12_13920 [Gammaproteobacteria bacterium]|nr:hypothetical protein [Gammaproteobacteria bacterium]